MANRITISPDVDNKDNTPTPPANNENSLPEEQTDAHDKQNTYFCEDCAVGKQTRIIYKTPSKPTSQPLELIHIDFNGPWRVKSLGKVAAGKVRPLPANALYFLLFVDDYTSYMWVYFCETKDQFYERFIEFKTMVEKQRADGLTIKRIRCDQALEFNSARVQEIIKQAGISFEPSAAYSAEQNGKAERGNRTLISMGVTIMHQAGLPKPF
jgi:histone deacetylase 1/2